jgi:hypothetical protein
MKQTSRNNSIESLDKKNLLVPGPGAYNQRFDASSQLRKSPKAFFAGKYTKQIATPNMTPSPLEYSPSVENIKKKSPIYKIGSQA